MLNQSASILTYLPSRIMSKRAIAPPFPNINPYYHHDHECMFLRGVLLFIRQTQNPETVVDMPNAVADADKDRSIEENRNRTRNASLFAVLQGEGKEADRRS